MIRNKPLFSGSAGKTKKLLTSRFMTTPRTIDTTDSGYYTGLYFSDMLRFICCSLNGLLWLAEGGAVNDVDNLRYFMVPFVWDPAAGEVIPIGGSVFNWYKRKAAHNDPTKILEDMPVQRGIDWVMTRFFIFQSIPEPPYIIIRNIKDMTVDDSFYALYSLHRNKNVNFFKTGIAEISGGRDPFTKDFYGADMPSECLPGTGAFGFTINMYGEGLYPNNAREAESCYATLPSVGDWFLTEDFLFRKPANPLPHPSPYTANYYSKASLIPVEFNWAALDVSYPSFGAGHKASRRGIQVSSFGGKLYARGLIYAGEAFILPAGFDENCDPGEYFLLITNSWDITGNLNEITVPVLDEANLWLSLAPVKVQDVNIAGEGQPACFMTEKTSPLTGYICTTGLYEYILTPANIWKTPRVSDVSQVVYDNSTKIILALGEKGVSFIGGDSAINSLVTLDDYSCTTLSKWLAPAGALDYISRGHVISSFDGSTVLTDITNKFARYKFNNRVLPLTWGVFEKKQNPYDPEEVTARVRLSFGIKDMGGDNPLVATEINAPADVTTSPFETIPWENVYRNPFGLSILRHDENSAYYASHWMLGDVKDILSLPVMDATFEMTNPVIPCIPIVYKTVNGPLGYIEFAYVNPDTGELFDSSYDFDGSINPDDRKWQIRLFPHADIDGVMGAICEHVDSCVIEFKPMIQVLPDWLNDGNWRRVGHPILDVDSQVPGLKMICIPLYYPSGGNKRLMGNDMDTYETGGAMIFVYGSPSSGYYPEASGVFKIRESSSNLQVLWRNVHFGRRYERATKGYAASGLLTTVDALNTASASVRQLARTRRARIRDWSEHGAGYYGSDPVVDYRGRTKYLKTFTIFGTNSAHYIPTDIDPTTPIYDSTLHLGTWGINHLYLMRADLDNTVFDFDAEMLRSKNFE